MATKTQEEEIEHGRTIERLLAEPAVQAAIADLDSKYWKDAKAGKSDAEIILAVAKARALGDLSVKLDAVVHNGKIATANRERSNR